MQELFLAKLNNLGVDASKFGLHIGVRAGHLLQLMQVWLIAYSSNMADGNRDQLRKGMSRTLR